MTELEELRRHAEKYLAEDPRVRRWQIRTDGAIALEVIAQGAVPPQDRYQILELLGRPLYRIDRPEGALDALLDDLVLVRVDVDGLREEAHPPDPVEELGRLNHRFWVDLWVAFGFLERGRVWKAIRWIGDLRETIFEVGRIAQGDPAIRDEAAVPERLQGALSQTICRQPDHASVGKAMLFAVYVYRQTRQEASSRLQVAFDDAVETRLIEHLNRFFALDDAPEISIAKA